ncbi:MAG TPA: hypothetical protein VIY72_02640, partial [Acidimicrobiales bacterium]
MDNAPLLDSRTTPTSPRLLRAMLAGHPATDGVEVIIWPDDAERRAALVEGTPTLLLVPPDVDAPVCGFVEEWVRLPAPMDDAYARLEMLRIRVSCT